MRRLLARKDTTAGGISAAMPPKISGHEQAAEGEAEDGGDDHDGGVEEQRLSGPQRQVRPLERALGPTEVALALGEALGDLDRTLDQRRLGVGAIVLVLELALGAVALGVGLQDVVEAVVLGDQQEDGVGREHGGHEHQQHREGQPEAALQERDALRAAGLDRVG